MIGLGPFCDHEAAVDTHLVWNAIGATKVLQMQIISLKGG